VCSSKSKPTSTRFRSTLPRRARSAGWPRSFAPGRKTSAHDYDALIAATAVAHGFPVYTRNPDDFAGIEALTVVPVGDAS
jgi:predicted nucleic acid-binding protein